ncbi:MAG: restriction endonuclease subunit S [Paludibacteraceae bacterium]|nr:restriction endonuclease subunit S [Paludibacteraceae bacterium]
MNKIEKLIKELCPNGVEWKKLGDVCTFQNGFAFKSQFFKENGNAIIRITNINKNTIDLNDVVFFDKSDYRENLSIYEIHNGDILVAMSGATTGKIGVYKGLDTCYLNQRVGTFRPFCDILSNQYLYHFLTTKVNDMYLLAGGGAQPNLSSIKLMSSLQIPLPPLPIQTEIVRILDKFVEQQEQLERLIELRKKQYEYYREEMLKPKEGEVWETKTIGELGTITRGRRFVRDDVRESGMPCIHYGDMYTYYGITARTTKTFLDRNFPKKMQYAKKGDVVVVGAGENDLDIGVGMVWEGDEPAAVHDACYILTHNQNSKYIAYFLRTNNYHQQLRKYVSDGKICSISGVGLGSCLIPIPSLKKQQEIVEFLDKFEFSITALTSALESSRRRYEYYRDEMMRF